MSYILDALRRADAERERGEVPGLQSQQQHAALDDEEAAPTRSHWMLAAIFALVIALVAAVGWNFVGGEPPRSPVVVAVAPVPVPVPVPVPIAPPPTLAVATAPSVAATPAPAPPPVATARLAEPRPAVRRAPASSPSTAPPATPSALAPSVPADKPPTAVPRAAAPEARIYARAELPADVQRALPQLAIGGASYSNDAASRMVIINGQVFHEGDKISAGLVLEKIKLKAAVLAYKGWRYQLDY